MGDAADDLTDVYALGREESKRRRAAHRDNSARILREHDVGYAVRNDGAHLVVRGTVDFWPGTGLWIVRATREEGRGVFALLRHLGVPTRARDAR
jgi:hypothetical protein